MVEVAFNVIKGSSFYESYFQRKAEKQKFHDYAMAFFRKHDMVESLGYYQEEYLAMQLSEEERVRFAPQLKKLIDRNDVSYFKKNSPMYKEWATDVVSKVDMNLIHSGEWWYLPYIGEGTYSLWDYEGVIYGYLEDRNKKAIQLTEEMIQIPLSEYHKVREELQKREEVQ